MAKNLQQMALNIKEEITAIQYLKLTKKNQGRLAKLFSKIFFE